MRITLGIGERLIAGELYENPVAQQIAALLPFSALFEDFHDQEKLTRLPQALDMSAAPRADEPAAGEIGYYAPGACLVLYYVSPGRWPELVCVGRIDLPCEELEALPDGTRIAFSAPDPV